MLGLMKAVTRAVHSLLAEPRAKDSPVRVWWDWLIVAVLMLALAVEMTVRDDVVFPIATTLVGIAMITSTLWRRIYPLHVVAAGFAAIIVFDIIALIVVGEPIAIAVGAIVVLTNLYALYRWGSGREGAIGLGVLTLAIIEALIVEPSNGPANAIALPAVLLVAAQLGWLVRTYAVSQAERRTAIRVNERELLARELHDTVAHRVSAIAISAQAGSVQAKKSPDVVESFAVIEKEAKRAMAEMRWIVSQFRDDDQDDTPGEFSARLSLADIEQLANDSTRPSLRVDFAQSGNLENLGPSVEATAYRLAQESITNAIRHATNATSVQVSVTGESDAVRLTVSDNGDAPTTPDTISGYGVIGMTERVALVGGSLEAGPQPGRGWLVEAVLPRGGS